ncbi:MAG: phosphocholine cytidylyltransferase family protein [Calditrichae bacterium]|nr:phosphocholine cytidylyltransferase family protein [Calditrichota bacterium]MCB9057388.1 phosphocholine cytidylyltransferase family protein [Calditrichia bacterium]
MPMKNTAIILAAGRGSRLKELSLEQPKPMTEVNNISIIKNLIRQLVANKIERIVVVVGYLADKLKSHILENFGAESEFIFIENEIFDKTNNIYSLYLAEKYMSEGFYLFEADVFCENKIVYEFLAKDENDIILIDKYTTAMNGTVVRFDENNHVLKMYLNKDQGENFDFSDAYKTLNFYKLSKNFVENYLLEKLRKHIAGENVHSYYEQIIKEAVDEGHDFYGLVTASHKWWEIDTIEDLEKAEKMFTKSFPS